MGAENMSSPMGVEAGGIPANAGFGWGGLAFAVGTPTAPTVGDIVGDKQRLLMDAVGEYNEAVDAARVLEPHIERVKLKVEIADDLDECAACGQVH